MQSVQRRFGRLLPRTADESQVAVLLKDFEDTDKMLTRLIEAAKSWQNSWQDILSTQSRLAEGFQSFYAPILGASDDYVGHVPLETDENIASRTTDLFKGYEELKADVHDDLAAVEPRIIAIAQNIKDSISPLKKVIKKREDRKLDYEKYQHRVDNARKKANRSEKDNVSLQKAETDLARTKEEYESADQHLRGRLPPVLTAAFSILPHVLSAQIMIQNSLLAQYYTFLHQYASDEAFQNPPPSAAQIIAEWAADQNPVQQAIEAFQCISGGKNLHKQVRTDAKNMVEHKSNNYQQQRRPSSHALIAPAAALTATADRSVAKIAPAEFPPTRPRPFQIPSQTSLSLSTASYHSSDGVSPSAQPDHHAHAPAGPRADYFGRERLPSNSSSFSTAGLKKKPPPPPPPKNAALGQRVVFVTALYDFIGQGAGDLSFSEGDRIRVLKRTDSIDDWWEGDLRGLQGSFPANYVRLT